MFGETPRNKMLRKMPLHSYHIRVICHYSVALKLERSSLLRVRRNEFNIVQKSP